MEKERGSRNGSGVSAYALLKEIGYDTLSASNKGDKEAYQVALEAYMRASKCNPDVGSGNATELTAGATKEIYLGPNSE